MNDVSDHEFFPLLLFLFIIDNFVEAGQSNTIRNDVMDFHLLYKKSVFLFVLFLEEVAGWDPFAEI